MRENIDKCLNCTKRECDDCLGKEPPKRTRKRTSAVYQIDLATGLTVAYFPSITEAAEATGFDPGAISRVARGCYRHTKGYRFEYARRGSHEMFPCEQMAEARKKITQSWEE